MKIVKKDYPFDVIIQDKIGKTSGKPYTQISIAFTSVKNKEAKDPKEKYETTYFNFFDEKDLLKLSSLCENAYTSLRTQKQEDREVAKQASELKGVAPKKLENVVLDEDTSIPF